MLELFFEGWFQCRLATNPDPSDELRGVSGHTFAVAGEPDLDRIIRFNDPVSPRSRAPRTIVKVVSVKLSDVVMDGHVLIGARVNLEDDAKFESRNRLLTEDRGGVGVIDPFVISVSNDDVMLTRNDIFDPNHPNARLIDLTDQQLQRRGPIDLEGMTIDHDTIAAATGILDAVKYRANRRKLLEVDVAESVDAVERAALHKRIDELRRAGARDLRIVMMTVLQRRRFALNGRAVVDDRSNLLGCTPDLTAKWPIEFWMGAWDSDALSGYIKGVLGLPCEKAGS